MIYIRLVAVEQWKYIDLKIRYMHKALKEYLTHSRNLINVNVS